MKGVAIILVLFTVALFEMCFCDFQTIKVSGRLFCGNRTNGVKEAKVKLFDKDRFLNPDDFLASNYTGADGTFYLEGGSSEATTIDPLLKIYHDCNDGWTPCQKEVEFMLPDKYISSGKAVDIGDINMEAEYTEVERDCTPF